MSPPAQPGSPRPTPGWHGKLPTLGDFASRRMDPGFLATWDRWLAQGLLELRQARPDGWLAAYLASPSWRFLLMPGVVPGPAGALGWAGVLTPSVDRVGRYFPFTLVWPLARLPAGPLQAQALWAWLGRLDELAADALQDDWTVDRLEAELARMALPTIGPAPGAGGPGPAGSADTAGLVGPAAQAVWQRIAPGQAQGLSFWQAHGVAAPGSAAAPPLHTSRGLPASAAPLLGATISAEPPTPPPP